MTSAIWQRPSFRWLGSKIVKYVNYFCFFWRNLSPCGSLYWMLKNPSLFWNKVRRKNASINSSMKKINGNETSIRLVWKIPLVARERNGLLFSVCVNFSNERDSMFIKGCQSYKICTVYGQMIWKKNLKNCLSICIKISWAP